MGCHNSDDSHVERETRRSTEITDFIFLINAYHKPFSLSLSLFSTHFSHFTYMYTFPSNIFSNK